MWANAKHDGRPAEYRWRPLFNAAKFDWRPLLECYAVTLPRCESRFNLQGYPKLANRSQPLVGRSSIYYQDMWRRYCCLTVFFRLLIHALAAKIQPDNVVRWCQNGDFLRPVLSASRVQHISDIYSKFALRPHHVWSMVDILSPTAEITRGKKERRKIEITGQMFGLWWMSFHICRLQAQCPVVVQRLTVSLL